MMGVTGDRYVAEYEGHTIELVRDNWVKTLALWIDGSEVARESRALPHNITLSATLEHNGVQHTVTAKSAIQRLVSTKDTIEVDGVPLPLTKTQ
jgi:hypothetical protein